MSLPNKSFERILFVSSLIPDINILNLRASLYFADCLSVRRIGRMISNDSYLPLVNGPMPLSLFIGMKEDLLKEYIEVKNTTVHHKRQPNLDLFSKSDLKCLGRSVEKYGRMEIIRLRVEFSSDKTLNVFGRTFDDEIKLETFARSLDFHENLLSYVNRSK